MLLFKKMKIALETLVYKEKNFIKFILNFC